MRLPPPAVPHMTAAHGNAAAKHAFTSTMAPTGASSPALAAWYITALVVLQGITYMGARAG